LGTVAVPAYLTATALGRGLAGGVGLVAAHAAVLPVLAGAVWLDAGRVGPGGWMRPYLLGTVLFPPVGLGYLHHRERERWGTDHARALPIGLALAVVAFHVAPLVGGGLTALFGWTRRRVGDGNRRALYLMGLGALGGAVGLLAAGP
jgi:hypothetical protein